MKSPIAIMRLLSYKTEFFNSNPEFYRFLVENLSGEMEQGTTIKIQVSKPDTKHVEAEVEIKAEDLKLFEEIRELVN